MKILYGSICKVGGRDYNQDYVLADSDERGGCFVVCDGLGSYIGSEVASRLCAEKIVEKYKDVKDIDIKRSVKVEYAESYFRQAHSYVVSNKEFNKKIASSCTTAAAVVTDKKETVIGHIGDTRVYFFDNYKLSFQTKDHSLAQLAVDSGQIELKDIRTHKDQNKLTRVLGSDYYVNPDIKVINKPLKVGDCFVLCTDGFWEYVYENEMEEDLKSSKTPQEAIDKMEARLLDRITRYNDNYSAIVVMVVNDNGKSKN